MTFKVRLESGEEGLMVIPRDQVRGIIKHNLNELIPKLKGSSLGGIGAEITRYDELGTPEQITGILQEVLE